MTGAEQIPTWLIVTLFPLFVVVAAVYAAVGLGGGTGYVAVMVLVGLPAESVPSTALLLNLLVAGTALLRYGAAGRLKMSVLSPFLLAAIPAALVGGICPTPHRALLGILGGALVVAAVATFRSAYRAGQEVRQPSLLSRSLVGLPCGALIGFVSGLVGIGGGVFFGPLVLLLHWSGPKDVAAMNAVLVVALSAAGLVGHGMRGSISVSLVVPLAIAALLGGLLGASLAERRLSATAVQRILAAVILVAGIKAALDAVWFAR